MAAPPKPPTPAPEKTPEDLAEVERALSVLQGRHPDHERVRREDEARRARRQAELDAAARVERRRILVTRARIAVVAAVVAVLAVVATLLVRREIARGARVDAATQPYRALGFSLVATSGRRDPSRLEAGVAPGCLLAVSMSEATSATEARGALRLTHAGTTLEGPGPVFTCVCEGGPVTITSEGAPADASGGGLLLMQADASVFGGSRASAFLPFVPGTLGRTDAPCAEAALDAWLAAKRWTDLPPARGVRPVSLVDEAASARWFSEDARRARLRSAGFAVTSIVEPAAPFAIVDVPAETCVLLVPERSHDRPSLRTKGSILVVGPAVGAVAWCTSAAAQGIAQRDLGSEAGTNRPEANTGVIAVLLAPASRVGGLFGVREIAESAGISIAAATVSASDRGWNAKQLLVASAIPESLVSVANAPDLGVDLEARVVAVSLEKPNGVVAEAPPDVFSFCDPPIDRSTIGLCVFSGSQTWRVDGANVVAGLARAKLPFWLFGMQGVSEPVALKRETELIALARKLRRGGFEPTTIDAVTELDRGAEVLGRAREDAMVVVSLAPSEPWVIPYTDGPVWSLDAEPRVIPIRPLERVTVHATTKTLPPKATRRTVVFRRHEQP